MGQASRRQEPDERHVGCRRSWVDLQHGCFCLALIPEKVDPDEPAQAGDRRNRAPEYRFGFPARYGQNAAFVVKTAVPDGDLLLAHCDQPGDAGVVDQEARAHGNSREKWLQQRHGHLSGGVGQVVRSRQKEGVNRACAVDRLEHAGTNRVFRKTLRGHDRPRTGCRYPPCLQPLAKTSLVPRQLDGIRRTAQRPDAGLLQASSQVGQNARRLGRDQYRIIRLPGKLEQAVGKLGLSDGNHGPGTRIKGPALVDGDEHARR